MTDLQRVLRLRRWRRVDAEAVVAALEASGATMGAFARDHGIHFERLRRWRRKLRGAGSQVEFAAVVVRAEPVRPAPDLELAIGPGIVRVPEGFDADHLRRVVAVLASC